MSPSASRLRSTAVTLLDRQFGALYPHLPTSPPLLSDVAIQALQGVFNGAMEPT